MITVDGARAWAISKISKQMWVAMGAAFLGGFIFHIQSFSGFIVNWDSAFESYFGNPYVDKFWIVTQGKWLTPIIVKLFAGVEIGSYSGILAIIFLSIAAGLIADIFELKQSVSAALIGVALVGFPSVMCTFMYTGEVIFSTAVLLTIFATFLIRKVRHGCLWGALVLTLALGIYASGIGFVASILLSLCIWDLVKNEKSEKEIICNGFKYIAVMLVAALLYYVVLTTALNFRGLELSGYRGIKEGLEHPTIAKIIEAAIGSYKKVIAFFFYDAYGRAYRRDLLAYRTIVGAIVIMLVLAVAKFGSCWKRGRMALIIVLSTLMPAAIHAIGILGQNADTHWLMIHSFVMVFVFAVVMAEKLNEKGQFETGNHHIINNVSVIMQWGVVITTVFILNNWLATTNSGYTKIKLNYEEAYATYIDVLDEVMDLPEYNMEKQVAFIGNDRTAQTDEFAFLGRFTGIPTTKDFFIVEYSREIFLRDYLGINVRYTPPDIRTALALTEEFHAMPSYPTKGYAQEIDGVIVVKFSDVA